MITIRLMIRMIIIVEMIIKMMMRLINTDDKNNHSLVTKMMTSNENNDQYGINDNENNTGNDTVDGIVQIIRIIMIRIMTDKIIMIRMMIMIGMT